MRKYMYLQRQQARVDLLYNSKTQEYIQKFGEGRELSFTPWSEKEFCTLVYTDELWEELTNALSNCIDDLGPDEMEDFADRFREAHPLVPVENVMECIRTCVVDEGYCILQSPLFRQEVKLTIAQEQELLNVIATRHRPPGDDKYADFSRLTDKDGVTIYQALEGYFKWHCSKYGVKARYKKDVKIQEHELTYHFCVTHGIDWWYATNKLIKPSLGDLIAATAIIFLGLSTIVAGVTGLFLFVAGLGHLG